MEDKKNIHIRIGKRPSTKNNLLVTLLRTPAVKSSKDIDTNTVRCERLKYCR